MLTTFLRRLLNVDRVVRIVRMARYRGAPFVLTKAGLRVRPHRTRSQMLRRVSAVVIGIVMPSLVLMSNGRPAIAQVQPKYESLTVDNTARTISSATLSGMAACVAVLETAEVRWRNDGTAPTSTTGTPVSAGTAIHFRSIAEAQTSQFIRTTGTRGTLHVNCFPRGEAVDVTGSGGGTATSDGLTDAELRASDVNVNVSNTRLAVNVEQIGGSSVVTANTECEIISAASNNSTNCKASAGSIYGMWFVNTTATVYYFRRYNTASAPTCSSSTGAFGAPIPIPASTSGNGVVINFPLPVSHSTGISYCITSGSADDNNGSAATGIFGGLLYQ
jgi:hypothetical protein